MKHSRYYLPGALFVALLVLVLGSVAAGAQQITGTIVGTVRDSRGAMVTTATITATNVDTSFSSSTTADSQGAYRIQYLPVGNYTVEVDAAGFKKFVQENLVITIDQTQTLNVKLTVGGESQTITVTEAPPLVDTETAGLGRTVDSDEIIGLPLVNRNAYAELNLTPGVMTNSASDSANPNGTPNFVLGVPSTQVVINGGMDNGVPMVSYYLDGGINMTGIRNYGNPLPNPDAIKEFRVETSNFAAQYGRMSAGVVSAVTKSGANRFHGSLFEFNRNTDLNAYYWKATTKTPYHRNNFGGTVGGPVKRDKAFFFGSYAGLRQIIGQQVIGQVFTAAERLGDFTGDSTKVYMPGTKTQVMGTNSSPGCGVPTLNCVPASLLDKTAATLMAKYIPPPNVPGGATYSGFYNAPTNQDEYLAKYDETISKKDRVAASFFYLNTLQYLYGGGDFPYMQNQSFAKQYNTNISDTHIFNATTINQAWLTYTRVMGGRLRNL